MKIYDTSRWEFGQEWLVIPNCNPIIWYYSQIDLIAFNLVRGPPALKRVINQFDAIYAFVCVRRRKFRKAFLLSSSTSNGLRHKKHQQRTTKQKTASTAGDRNFIANRIDCKKRRERRGEMIHSRRSIRYIKFHRLGEKRTKKAIKILHT